MISYLATTIEQPARPMQRRSARAWVVLLAGVCVALSLPAVVQRAVSQEVGADGANSESAELRYPLSVEGPQPADIEPPTAEVILSSVTRGIDYLLDSQTDAGYWGRSANPKYFRIWAPVPGSHYAFRTATTALCLDSLIEVSKHCEGKRLSQVEQAIDLGQEWLLEEGGKLRRSEPDAYDDYFGYPLYNVWGHAFAIHALKSLHERAADEAGLKQRLLDSINYHVDRLQRDELLDGGWGYYDHDNMQTPRLARFQRPTGSSSSFTTATVLIALKDAEALGIEFPQKQINRAMASLRRQRYPDFSYAYGEYLSLRPRYSINRPAGSLGRSQVCNLAMRLYGDEDVTLEVLRTWLNRLIARNGWLSMSRKRHIPGESPHFGDFGVAGYFYYYGHYYAAKCIQQLPESERAHFEGHLAALLLPKQEKDGSWWDYMLYGYHQQYGTAMALYTLSQALPEPIAE